MMAISVLIVGGGGREHALAWKDREKPPRVERSTPRRATTRGRSPRGVSSPPVDDLGGCGTSRWRRGIDLTVVGPEAPLLRG